MNYVPSNINVGAVRTQHFSTIPTSPFRSRDVLEERWKEFRKGPLGNVKNLNDLFTPEAHKAYTKLSRRQKEEFREIAYKTYKKDFKATSNIRIKNAWQEKRIEELMKLGMINGWFSETRNHWQGRMTKGLERPVPFEGPRKPRQKRSTEDFKPREQVLLPFGEDDLGPDLKEEDVPTILTDSDPFAVENEVIDLVYPGHDGDVYRITHGSKTFRIKIDKAA